MKKVILLFSLLLLFSGCGLNAKQATDNVNKQFTDKDVNREINNKLKSGELVCNTEQDCVTFGYTCTGDYEKIYCLKKGDVNISNGEQIRYSSCVCRNSNLDY